MNINQPTRKTTKQAQLAKSVSLILKQLAEECSTVKLELLAHFIGVATLQAEKDCRLRPGPQ